jgi:hypothetical protein
MKVYMTSGDSLVIEGESIGERHALKSLFRIDKAPSAESRKDIKLTDDCHVTMIIRGNWMSALMVNKAGGRDALESLVKAVQQLERTFAPDLRPNENEPE